MEGRLLASSASVGVNDAPSVIPAPTVQIAAAESNATSTESAEPPSEGSTDLLEVPESESVNVWPDDAAESVFLSESRAKRETPVSESPASVLEDAADAKPLPSLDDLVQKIPEESRELLDELFRAKFTKVRRVKAGDLKASQP